MDKSTFEKKNSLLLVFSWKLKKVYEKTFERLIDKFQLTQNEIDVLLFLHKNAPLIQLVI